MVFFIVHSSLPLPTPRLSAGETQNDSFAKLMLDAGQTIADIPVMSIDELFRVIALNW